MSYLDVPRLHFAGKFFADPSTINNRGSNYSVPAAAIDALLARPTLSPSGPLLWNPRGNNWFFFSDCTVRSCLDNTGAMKTTASGASGDALVTGKVESPATVAIAKLVDLDPELQSASAIYGMNIKVTLSNGAGGFTATLKTVPMRDLWFGRAGSGMPGAGGVYQSVLTNVKWDTTTRSPVFDQLKAASPNKLSIKFVAYAYDANSGPDVNPPPAPPATFCFGKVVGTIGPVLAGEPDHFVAARMMNDGTNGLANGQRNAWSGAFGPAPFKVDTARNKVIIDLGNAIPETSPGGARKDIGDLTPLIDSGAGLLLPKIDYSTARYELTAGIEERALSSTQKTALATKRLTMVANKPVVSTVLTERPSGRYLDVSQIAMRLNPAESTSVEVAALEFGAPKSGQVVGIKLLAGTPAGGLTAPANLSTGTSVTTAANGRASVTFTGGNPASPRAGLDGQLYKLGFFWGAASAGDLRAVIFIHVYDSFPAVANPTFADVKPILEPYNKIYPSMKIRLNLGSQPDIDAYRKNFPADADRMKLMIGLSEDDPRYMPVTRDLSRDKRKVLLDWLNRGAPP